MAAHVASEPPPLEDVGESTKFQTTIKSDVETAITSEIGDSIQVSEQQLGKSTHVSNEKDAKPREPDTNEQPLEDECDEAQSALA